jgi:hypothetical protein
MVKHRKKVRRIAWIKHITRIGKMNSYKIFVLKPKKKNFFFGGMII